MAADPLSMLSSFNPFSNFKIGGFSTVANVILVVILAVLIICVIGGIIWWKSVKKSYWIKIHVFKLVGNTPTRIAIFRGKDVPFGFAGDKLWRVAPNGFTMIFKIIKWIPVGKYQAADNEFWYWVRQDGEWINFAPTNIDEVSKKMNIQFVQEDMRLQRLATERLLEQRLMNKTFWEKYGTMIATLVFFLVVTVCMVVIFYQFSTIVDKISKLLNLAQAINTAQTSNSLIPA